MSLGEDIGSEYFEPEIPRISTHYNDKYEPIWTTKDKKEIPIKDLEVNHIKNILKNNGKLFYLSELLKYLLIENLKQYDTENY